MHGYLPCEGMRTCADAHAPKLRFFRSYLLSVSYHA
jgi:hypothetical protein